MNDDMNIIQHFRASEKGFVEQVQDFIKQANDEYRPVLTNFLNPRERLIAESLVNRESDLRHKSFGGYKDSEMQRMLIYPTYYTVTNEDFKLQALEIVYPVKFAEIKHYQVLGTLINQGIKRNTFGDILGNETVWQVVVDQKLLDFFVIEVNRIGNIKVHLEPIDFNNLIYPQNDWEEKNLTVASLRLDTVLANCFNISRSKIKQHIESGFVNVNWLEILKPDFELTIGDIVSIRKFGRLRITELNGNTKRDKLKLSVEIIQKK